MVRRRFKAELLSPRFSAELFSRQDKLPELLSTVKMYHLLVIEAEKEHMFDGPLETLRRRAGGMTGSTERA